MIKRIDIGGVMATVAFLDDDRKPVKDEGSATLLEAHFDDGRIVFMRPKQESEQ